MTTTIELQTPVNIAGGKKGAERIERLQMGDLVAGHLWDCPATDLGARDTLTVGLLIAGFDATKAVKIARELEGGDLFQVTDAVNVAIKVFEGGAETVKEAEFDPSVPHTLVLKDPLELGAQVVSELTLRPLKGKDVWDVPSSGLTWGDMLGVGASQTGQADAIIRKLSAWDTGQLVGMVTAFLTAFRETGAKT